MDKGRMQLPSFVRTEGFDRAVMGVVWMRFPNSSVYKAAVPNLKRP